LYIAYPTIFLQIDFNESEVPDRVKYLESMKRGYLEQLAERSSK
jgi:hypothetical protein